MTRGGKREGAGRPPGSFKEKTVMYARRILPEFVPIMDKFLDNLKSKKNTPAT